jgi:anti-sigma factor (TIGR02949 family)
MSCGDPHETDCSEILGHLYEFLDREVPEGECAKFEVHFVECSRCLERYGLEQAVKKLVKRCCGRDDVPTDLRSKVMERIELLRAREPASDQTVTGQQAARQQEVAQQERGADTSAPPTRRTAESA